MAGLAFRHVARIGVREVSLTEPVIRLQNRTVNVAYRVSEETWRRWIVYMRSIDAYLTGV